MEAPDIRTALKRALAPAAAEMAEVERIISAEMASDIRRAEEIGRYITSAGGKRMRPALLILMAKALGAESRDAAFLGAVIEVLHTATLMHDDVVDEGKTRRGRATANANWGNAQAVLVGDFLYTRSFQMMVRFGNLRVMQALSNAANRLSEGEVLQLTNTHDPEITEERYLAVIERKTSCLFEAAARMAAAISPASPGQEEACVAYAMHLGNAFQITDDILDYRGVAADVGKNLGADLREGKVTLPMIYAREAADAKWRERIDTAVRSGEGGFEAISAFVAASGALERCQARALEEAERGREALSALEDGLFKDSLIELLFCSARRDR